MYLCFCLGGRDLKSFIILGFSSVPMLHSSTSLPLASILGFLATSLKSNKSYSGTRHLGNTLLFSCRIPESISFSFNSSTSTLLSLNSLESTLFTLALSKTDLFTISSSFSKSMFVHSKSFLHYRKSSI
jgi:hypothetical protein